MSRTWHTHLIDLDGDRVTREPDMPRTKYAHEGDAIVQAYVPAFVLDNGTLRGLNVRNVALSFDYDGDEIDWDDKAISVPSRRVITDALKGVTVGDGTKLASSKATRTSPKAKANGRTRNANGQFVKASTKANGSKARSPEPIADGAILKRVSADTLEKFAAFLETL